jgi:hypothetical protein
MLFFSKDFVKLMWKPFIMKKKLWIVEECSLNLDPLKNSGDQYKNEIHVVHDFFLLIGIIQKLTLQTYFPRKRNL